MKKGEWNTKEKRAAREESVVELDFKADVVAAIEAIRRSPASQVLLVLPDVPGPFGRFTDLRLLKQFGLILDKQIVLATSDPAVIKLAASLKLAVRDKPLKRRQQPAKPEAVPVGVFQPTPMPSYSSAAQPSARVEKSSHGWRFMLNFLVFVVAVVSLLAGIYFLWPQQATINIKTYVSPLRANVEAELSQTARAVDARADILPLTIISKDGNLQYVVEATGAASGSKAGGVVEIYNCSTQQDLVIDTQTVFRKDGRDFVLRSAASEVVIPPKSGSGDCDDPFSIDSHRSLGIEAVAAGVESNLEAGNYQIVGLDENDYNVVGFEFSGGAGTAACVTPDDLERAREALSQQRNDPAVRQELADDLKQEHDLIPLEVTFQVATAQIQEPPTCPEISDQPLSQVIIYYLGGVKRSDIAELIMDDLQLEAGDLTVVNDGLETARYSVHIRLGSEQPKPTIQQPAALEYYVIIEIDDAAASIILDRKDILAQITGSRANQVAGRLRRLEGVKSVEVELSPFWVNSLPANERDIIINIDNQDMEEGFSDE